MKILTLLRHAKSDWDDPSQRDFDRPLNARGRAAAMAMGEELRRLGLAFDRVVASPSRRTTETLERLGRSYGPLPVTYDERVYLASVPTLLRIVQSADDARDQLMIVGHNPGMEQLTLGLARDGELRDRAAAKFPTGALAELRFDVVSWSEADDGAGTLARFIRPRDLAAGKG
jgi:phosphohistidine phosphatase